MVQGLLTDGIRMAHTHRLSIRDVRDQLDVLSGQEQIDSAVVTMNASRDLEIVRFVIDILREAESPALRDAFVTKYEWCDDQPHRRDGGGFIRAALVRALKPISSPEDSSLFQRAILTYEMDGPTEVCGDLRAAGILALNEVDPDLAANHAARFLLDPQFTFSGEPITTAIRLLASHGNLAPIFGAVSWGVGRSDVIAEGLRNLVELKADLLPILIDRYIESEDEQIVLGLFELLLGHHTRDTWVTTMEEWFRATTVMDLYGIVAIQVVGSRSETLINMLRHLRNNEFDRLRQGMLDQALALA